VKAAQLLDHPVLRQIVEEARRQGLSLYLVGGAVRARLIAPESEIDNADLLLLGEVQAFAQGVAGQSKSRAVTINPKFDTVLIPAAGIEFEISAPRHLTQSPLSAEISALLPEDHLLKDLWLRDFTINALALPLSLQHEELVDPTGGAQDLKQRLIRTPIPADITLCEDPLRILRAARLATQLDFSLHPDLLKAMHTQRAQLAGVSVERKTAELIKILMSPQPSVGLKLLYVTGVLDVCFPEIAALAAMKPDRRPHHKDVFEHTLKVLDTVAKNSPRLETRLAALLHDIGKPATRHWDAQDGWTFHGHEVVGERLARKLGRSWKLPTAVIDNATKLVRLHMRPINLADEGVTDSAVRRLGFQAGEDIDELITLCRADVTSADPDRVKLYLENFEKVVAHLNQVEEKDQFRAFQSPVRGETIMQEAGIEAGPLVGRLKTALEEAILDGLIPNEYEAALNYLRKIKDEVMKEAAPLKQKKIKRDKPIPTKG
jgi:poly(A) polymerase